MDQTLHSILDSLEQAEGCRCDIVKPLPLGLLHEKWLIRTDRGMLFVKRYHPARYGRRVPGIWEDIEQTLRLQDRFHRAGGRCPRPHPDRGSYLRATTDGDRFVAMDYADGTLVPRGEATAPQMRSLGEACAAMHVSWKDVPPPASEPEWTYHQDELLAEWQRRWEQLSPEAPAYVRDALRNQGACLQALEKDAFSDIAAGWAHLDFWFDNLLFQEERVAAILDFDRARYSYPLMDIGRAVLNGCWQNGRLRPEAAAAFAEGYRAVRPLSRGELLQAVRLCWSMESFWWIREDADTFDTVPRRFFQEMVWTAEQWDHVAAELGNI